MEDNFVAIHIHGLFQGLFTCLQILGNYSFVPLNRGWKRNHLNFDIRDSCHFYLNDS